MTVKKQFEELAAFLEANKTRKVGTVLPELLAMMSRKNNASGQPTTFLKDEDGNVVAVFCYYHKKYELVAEVPYGVKSGTATGLNTMCKEGTSNWSKQQRQKKTNESHLLTKLVSKEIAADQLGDLQAFYLEESKVIVPRTDEHGFDTLEEVQAHLGA
jgi:hypothetical protein